MIVQRWGVVLKSGEFYTTRKTREEAEREARLTGGNVVLLNGELPEPKKKLKLAPALVTVCGNYCFSSYLYPNEKVARERISKGVFVCWPAPVDKDGFIEVEVESCPE